MPTNTDLSSVPEGENFPAVMAADRYRQSRLGGPRVILYLLAADLVVVAAAMVGVVCWWLLR